MNETKWTPGPWACELYTTGAFVSGSAVTVASVFGYTIPEGKASGNLISAAPDLYAALDILLDIYTSLVNSGDAGSWNPEEENEVILARRVMAKARGEVA